MVLKQLGAPQQPGDHHAHDDGRGDHADVVDEGVHDVEVRQTRAGGEQDEGQDGGRDADDEGGLLRRQVELLPHAGGDHWMMEMKEVSPAMEKEAKKSTPKNAPPGIWAMTVGR